MPNKHINKRKSPKTKAPFKEIFIPVVLKSRAGVEYTHYERKIVSNE